MYRMFGSKTRCITGDVQMANGTQSRLWGLAAIVGVEEEGVISKETGRCSALSFASGVKKKLTWHLEHDNFIFCIASATPISEKMMINSLLCQ